VALSSAQANLAKDQAQLNDAKLNVERYAQLVKRHIRSSNMTRKIRWPPSWVDPSRPMQARSDNAK